MRNFVLLSVKTAIAAAALAVTFAATTAEAKAPLYVGKWATTAAECQLPPSNINAPIVLARRTFDQFETHCALSNILGAKNVWTAKTRCVTNGAVSRPRLTLWATAKALSLKWSDQHGRDNNVRCR